MSMCRYPQMPEESIQSPEAKVTGGCQSTDMSAGNWTWVSCKFIAEPSLQPYSFASKDNYFFVVQVIILLQLPEGWDYKLLNTLPCSSWMDNSWRFECLKQFFLPWSIQWLHIRYLENIVYTIESICLILCDYIYTHWPSF